MNTFTQTLLDKIDYSVVFTVDRRYDNFPNIKQSLENAGFNNIDCYLSGDGHNPRLPYDRINVPHGPPLYAGTINYATWMKPRAYNAWLSRRNVLELCDTLNRKCVAFFEDDIIIEEDFIEILDKITPTLGDSWDMLYFGAYHHYDSYEHTIHPNLLKLKSSGGWHGLLLKDNVIKELLKYPALGPYDWMCQQFIHNKFNCYAIYPSVISQVSGYSYIEGHNLEKPSRYHK